jgi:hypothetical protein
MCGVHPVDADSKPGGCHRYRAMLALKNNAAAGNVLGAGGHLFVSSVDAVTCARVFIMSIANPSKYAIALCGLPCLRCGMDNELTQYLKPAELVILDETEALRVKSRRDAAYYGATIRQIWDRARSRRALKIKREQAHGH